MCCFEMGLQCLSGACKPGIAGVSGVEVTGNMTTRGRSDVQEIAYRRNNPQHQLVHLAILLRTSWTRRGPEISEDRGNRISNLL